MKVVLRKRALYDGHCHYERSKPAPRHSHNRHSVESCPCEEIEYCDSLGHKNAKNTIDMSLLCFVFHLYGVCVKLCSYVISCELWKQILEKECFYTLLTSAMQSSLLNHSENKMIIIMVSLWLVS